MVTTAAAPGTIIRDARTAAGMTAAALAERVGCSTQNVTSIERGKSHPSVKVAKAIAETLGIDWTKLV